MSNKVGKYLRDISSSPLSVSAESNHSTSPISSPFNGKSIDSDDDERISVSSPPVKSHQVSSISNYSMPNQLAKLYGYSLGQGLPNQFSFSFGFPFPYGQQYDLNLANNFRSNSPFSSEFNKSPDSQQQSKNLTQHQMNVDSMSAALQLQLAAAAAARHRFSVDGIMLNNSQAQGSHPLFPSHGQPHSLISGASLHHQAALASGGHPTAWLPHPAGPHGLGGLPGAHPLNPFHHWLAQTSGPLSPSQSKFFSK
ncbi:hypothetical protein BLA29_003612 [Euroglyphus maynei]|uniref:Uncharacterized protein n=1 Tax=Euroglyphus maynei TaxID=6958 RepID=A0A1Y3B6I6_EURMA|nr:hypothetical protein BLA29_003612 [Euroglyphus maynei]